uniref:Cytoplasmic dynein 2 heavy chain 1 n=1 Tax=Strongyloides papillosus TaxID=174720 RepID=A0A0N5CE75_STREA
MATNNKSSDSRRGFILRIASHILSLNLVEEKLPNLQAICDFCDNGTKILVISRSEQRGRVEISNEFDPSKPALLHVVFIKNEEVPLEMDTYKTSINVVAVKGTTDGVTALGTLQNVFNDVIGKEIIPTNNNTSIEENRFLVKEQGSFDLIEEINHWKKRRNTNEDPGHYWDYFEILEEKYYSNINYIENVLDFMETCEDCIENLWQTDPGYPEKRMTKLINSVSREIIKMLLKVIDKKKIWNDEECLKDLNTSFNLCESWNYSIKMLTGKVWKQDPFHQWKGGEHEITFFESFLKRIHDILSIRNMSKQVELMFNDQIIKKEVDKIINNTMNNVNLLDFNECNEDKWKRIRQEYDENLKPLMEKIYPALKSKIMPSKLDSSLLINNLIKYKVFINRNDIKKKLASELELLLDKLLDLILQKRKELIEFLEKKNFSAGRYLTEIATKIIWIRQQKNQAIEMKVVCQEIMKNLQKYKNFEENIIEYIKDVEETEGELFDEWCRKINNSITDSSQSINLEITGKIMEIDVNSGRINISYSDNLVKLLREVRQLLSMGLNIPGKILNVVSTGEKFYRYGIILKQVAHFYNTIEEQMLPCHQAMMLEEAVAFEKLILPKKSSKENSIKVTWDDPKKLETYIEKLQKAAEKLTLHNRRLRRVHEEIMEIICKMMELDLLRSEEKWKQCLSDIRGKINDEKRYVGDVTNMNPWNIHVDRQLYKALYLQYLWGIECLQNQINKIHVQLVFKHNIIQFVPSFEEIKMKYYNELKKFISLPSKFKGIQTADNSENTKSTLFSKIIDQNIRRFFSLYDKTEKLFEKVNNCKKPFEEWIVIAYIDLEALIEEKFTKANDWESQLKLLKTKGKELDKIPDEIKIDCIHISTILIKGSIEDLLGRLYDTLIWTLKHSVTTELNDINRFIDTSIKTLSIRPQSIEEIAEANIVHGKLVKAQNDMKNRLQMIEEKNTLLRSVGGSGVEQLSSTTVEWDKLIMLLDNHQEMIKDQIEAMKEAIGGRVSQLNDEGEKLHVRWKQFKPKNDVFSESDSTLKEAITFIKEKRLQLNELLEAKNKILSDLEQFGLEEIEFSILNSIDEDIKDAENNFLIFEEFNEGLQKYGEEEWIVFRNKTYLLEEYINEWEVKLKEFQPTHASIRIGKEIDLLKEFILNLKYLCGEVLSIDHWLEIFRILNFPKGTSLEKLKFNDLLNRKDIVNEKVDDLRNINARAHGEITMREALQELELWSGQAEFVLTDYKHSNKQNIKIVKEWKDLINQVKDNSALLQSLKASPFYKDFSDKTLSWEQKLASLDEYLGNMMRIQRKWIYLEPIFGRGCLPSEMSRFNRVDIEFRSILNDISRDKRVISLVNRKGLKNSLEQIVDQLNRCQKALNTFLEEKRNAFPRFYFLGDDDLLEILGQSQNPNVIQSHLKKLFQGINKVVFNENQSKIIAIVSSDGENVILEKEIEVVSNVEIWLTQLTDEMKNTIKKLVGKCLNESSLDLGKYPSQILCLCEEIRFCREIEDLLKSNLDLVDYHKKLNELLDQFTGNKVDDKVLSLKLKALILDLIHHISIVECLMKEDNKLTIDSWIWQKQLRFYYENHDVIVKMSSASFNYSYEYQGNSPKLVYTPLTDKCYLTLTQALSMGLGGNPYGPAGTGKTESVKALASAMGRQVLVFNCDEGIDLYSMSRIFIGLVQCGAWGCFDEFNRLESGVLSAISMLISAIQNSISKKTGKCTLDKKTVSVNENSAIFVTLNPAVKGYGGRQKLPDNLKLLFRPVFMSAPDNELIAETLMYSDGFKDAKNLATKIVSLFKVCKEMLTNQQHYDWGLRALKTIIKSCGDMLNGDINKNEVNVVIEALSLNTMSKLTYSDSIRFEALIKDVFQNAEKRSPQFTHLIEPLKKAAENKGIKLSSNQINKIFELYEQLKQRMGVVIIGPTYSGKSLLWQILKEALIISGKNIDVMFFNPKSMERNHLLGYMNLDTREWNDGVLTLASRRAVRNVESGNWIICDGEIDPEWIEALNSVLDDNRLLTMPSGERIQFEDNVNFIFETDDLSYASPATISRMGVIFISEEDIDINLVIRSWIDKNKDNLPEIIDDWMTDIFIPTIEYVLTKKNEFSASKISIIENGLSSLHKVKTKNDFIVRIFRSLLAFVSQKEWHEFSGKVFSDIGVLDLKNLWNVCYEDRTDSIITYSDDLGMGMREDDLRKEFEFPYILTSYAQSRKDIVSVWLQDGNRHPILLYGPDGCGKEYLIKSCLENDPDSTSITIYCSSQTKPVHIDNILIQHTLQVSAVNGKILKPKDKNNLIIYIKGINLSSTDKYGTSSTVAFLQGILTYNGYYDANCDWVSLENIQFIFSVSTLKTSDGNNQLSKRFLSKLRIVTIECPGEEELITIYTELLKPILISSLSSPSKIESLSSSIIKIYQNITEQFTPALCTHYLFTPKYITKLCLSLIRYGITESNINAIIVPALSYECLKIFGDRLINNDHRIDLDNIISNILGSIGNKSSFFISSSVTSTTSPIGKMLQMISEKEYTLLVEKFVGRYQYEVSNFRHTLHQEFISLSASIDRILSQPGGNLLICSVSGIGSYEAINIVGYMQNMKIFSPKITSDYGVKQFFNDLKSVISWASVDNQQVLLRLENHQLINNSFLEAINSLLTSGTVPGLFNQQELDGIISQLNNLASQEGYRKDLYSFLSHKVKQNLHIVIILNIDNFDFNKLLTANPALYKDCSVIWKESWNESTLRTIPTLMLKKINFNKTVNIDNIGSTFLSIFNTVDSSTRTPANYTKFVENFIQIFDKKYDFVEKKLNHLKAGIEKLTETRDSVSKLQKAAALKSKKLASKQKEADSALVAITQSMSGATDQKADMEQLKEDVEKESIRIEEQKKIIDEQLSEVEPLLKEARKAVGAIKSESLSEIRSLRAPPEAIRDILQAVLLFMGIMDTSWEAMRKFLGKSGVKDEIINFDARKITSVVGNKVSALIKQKEASFEEKNAKRASVAAAPLASWVKANLQYAKILEKIQPLEKEKEKLLKNLQKSKNQMENLSKGLLTVDAKVVQLKENFEELMKEATQIKLDLEKEQAIIGTAETLVKRLEGEYQRWREQNEILQKELHDLERKSIIAAGFVTFMGTYSEDLRSSMLEEWCKILNIEDFNLTRFLATDNEILSWKRNGLPEDQLSIENTTILFNSIDYCLIIDTTGRVPDFLYKELQDSNVEVIKAGRNDFLLQIELGVRFGKTIIVNDIVDIEPGIFELLRRTISTQGPRQVIQIGSNDKVDFNPSFKLFLCTKNTHIKLPTYVSSLLTEVNYSTTKSGLTAQLLSLSISIQKPELDRKSSELTSEAEKMQIKLHELENVLLDELANSTGSIIENKQLLDSLNDIKENSEKIGIALKESEQLQKELSKQRNVYLELANKSSALYFAIKDLHKQNNMYNFGVNTIIKLFKKVLIENGKDEVAGKLENLYKILRQRVFIYVSRGLFKANRLMYTLNFIHKTKPELFQKNEWNFFIGTLEKIEENIDRKKNTIPWLSENSYSLIDQLEIHFPKLYNTLKLSDLGTWNDFSKAINAEENIPPSIESSLSLFQKVILIQITRPDRLHTAINNFACNALGIDTINPPPLNLKEIFENESNEEDPILILTGPGADPSQDLEELASQIIGIEKYIQISMGQGQQEIAIQNLEKASEEGLWLCIKNIHLVPQFLTELQKKLALIIQRHSSFRLWITSECDESFPTTLVQDSLKITFESPPGLENNVSRTYTNWIQSITQDQYVFDNVKQQAFFILAYIHGLLQERRTFIPQGWINFYEFSNGDLRAGKTIVDKMSFNNKENMDWKTFKGLISLVVYGGRILNDFDNRILLAYLDKYLNEKFINGTEKGEICKSIKMPAYNNIIQYKEWIKKNLKNEGEIQLMMLGLPLNILSSWEITESKETIRQLKSLELTTVNLETLDRNTLSENLKPILQLWKSLNSNESFHNAIIPEVEPNINPIIEAIESEFSFALTLLQQIHIDLSLISKSLKGALSMDSKIKQLCFELITHQLPMSWSSKWNGPQDPLQYMKAVVIKTKSIRNLVNMVSTININNLSFDLSYWLRPSRCLNSLRQLVARKSEISLDQLKLATSWDKSLIKSEYIAEIKGLQIEGALFNGESLSETLSNSSPVNNIPLLNVAWIQKTSPDVYDDKNSIEVPLYENNLRENFVTTIQMPFDSQDDKEKWTIMNIALFLKENTF